MDSISFHLILNHVPIFACLGGTPLLIYGMVKNNDSFKKLGLGLFVLAALVVIPVFLTGEKAEELVEHLPGVLENLIEAHEEWAEASLWAMIGLGVSSVVALWAEVKAQSWRRFLLPAVTVFSCLVAGMMLRTAHLGGQIRHSEIRVAQGAALESEKEKKSLIHEDKENGDDIRIEASKKYDAEKQFDDLKNLSKDRPQALLLRREDHSKKRDAVTDEKHETKHNAKRERENHEREHDEKSEGEHHD